jgi:hypothetical protein
MEALQFTSCELYRGGCALVGCGIWSEYSHCQNARSDPERVFRSQAVPILAIDREARSVSLADAHLGFRSCFIPPRIVNQPLVLCLSGRSQERFFRYGGAVIYIVPHLCPLARDSNTDHSWQHCTVICSNSRAALPPKRFFCNMQVPSTTTSLLCFIHPAYGRLSFCTRHDLPEPLMPLALSHPETGRERYKANATALVLRLASIISSFSASPGLRHCFFKLALENF